MFAAAESHDVEEVCIRRNGGCPGYLYSNPHRVMSSRHLDGPGPMDTPSLAAAAPSGSPCWKNTRCLYGDGLVGSCWEIPAGCRVGGVVNRTGPASCELGIRHLTRRTPRKLRGSGPKTDGAPIDRLRGWGVWQHPATTPEHGGRDVHSEEVVIAVMQKGSRFTRLQLLCSVSRS